MGGRWIVDQLLLFGTFTKQMHGRGQHLETRRRSSWLLALSEPLRWPVSPGSGRCQNRVLEADQWLGQAHWTPARQRQVPG
jgi:hypothetical protein